MSDLNVQMTFPGIMGLMNIKFCLFSVFIEFLQNFELNREG